MKEKLLNTRSFAMLLFIVLVMMTQQLSARNTGNHQSISPDITYTITASPIIHATISFSPGSTVDPGTDVTVNITTDAGYEMADLIVDGVSVGAQNSYTFNNVTSDHTISGQTVPSVYSITISAGAGGSIVEENNFPLTNLPYGTNRSVNIVPDKGYHITNVLVDGTSIGDVNNYDFSFITSNHTISAAFAINTYTITTKPFTYGTIDESSSVNYGDNKTVNFTANEFYEITDVIVDGVSIGPLSSYTFHDINADHTITARADPVTYSITVSAGSHGSIVAENNFPITGLPYGQRRTLNIIPDEGYHITDVLVDDASVGAVASYLFIMLANHTISATFAINTYTITASLVVHGNISLSPGSTVDYGGDVTANITATEPGYEVYDVVVDGVSVGVQNSYTFSNVTADHTISAQVVPSIYYITTSTGEHGSIVAENNFPITGLPYGQRRTLNIIPDAGYHITDVLVDGASVGAVSSYLFPFITSNHTISATFAINTYTITTNAGANGSIDPATIINYGSDATINITPNIGYHVADVLVDGSSVGAVTSYTFSSVTSDHSISTTFASNVVHTIKATAGANGSISPSGTVSVYSGNNQTYTITPLNGYHVAVIKVDGVSVDTTMSYTFTNVTANHTISVTFAINSYTISSSAGINGSISPIGTVKVNFGGSKIYTIKPAAGYTISEVLVDGMSVGKVTTYIFMNVTANHIISASFAVNAYTITASAGDNGIITPNGITLVDYGGSITYKIVPDLGYRIESVMVDGVSKGSISSYTFNKVNFSHTITANFAINTYTLTSGSGSNGTIFPNGITAVNYGGSQTYMIIPNAGYAVKKVTVDGVSVSLATSYSFTNVIANHKISASFICIKPATPLISGPAIVNKQQDNLVYTVDNSQTGNSYTWTVPSGAIINSGQGTSSINIKWGKASGKVGCTASNSCSNSAKTTYAVTIGAAFTNTMVNESDNANAMEMRTTLKVNPNPVQDRAKVTFNVLQPCKCSIQLRNLTGKVVSVIEVNAVKGVNAIDLDVSHFTSGTYFISLINNEEIKTIMLIKAK